MTNLFRGMKEDQDGLPVLEASARGLGVRPGIDVPAERPGEVVRPGQGGVSVSPNDPLNLPKYRRPPEFQGDGKDPLWTIADSDLAPGLRYRVDAENSKHGFLEPARQMSLSEYEIAINATRKLWRKVSKP
jgi:hypothetical protein